MVAVFCLHTRYSQIVNLMAGAGLIALVWLVSASGQGNSITQILLLILFLFILPYLFYYFRRFLKTTYWALIYSSYLSYALYSYHFYHNANFGTIMALFVGSLYVYIPLFPYLVVQFLAYGLFAISTYWHYLHITLSDNLDYQRIFLLVSLSWLFSIMTYLTVGRRSFLKHISDERYLFLGKSSSFLLHELKGPLNKSLQRESKELEQSEIFQMLELISVMEQMLKGDLLEEGKQRSRSIVDLRPVVNQIQSLYQNLIDSYEITINITGEGELRAEMNIVRVILKKLFMNALEEVFDKKCRVVNILLSKNRIKITNKISEGHIPLNKMFRPQITTKKNVMNQGMGLYVAQLLAQNGGLKLNSSIRDGEISFELSNE